MTTVEAAREIARYMRVEDAVALALECELVPDLVDAERVEALVDAAADYEMREVV